MSETTENNMKKYCNSTESNGCAKIETEEIKSFEDWLVTDSLNGYIEGEDISYDVMQENAEGYNKYVLDHPLNNPKPKEDLNNPEMVVRTRFNHVIESLDGKHGTGYASKNPNLVMHLMDQIQYERQIQSE